MSGNILPLDSSVIFVDENENENGEKIGNENENAKTTKLVTQRKC